MVHTAVVEELAAVPVTALVTAPDVAETVVNSAIEANVRAPEAVMPSIAIADVTPIGRCPQRTYIRRNHPDPRHPVITGRSITPIAGIP
jgi:hypothetical protein